MTTELSVVHEFPAAPTAVYTLFSDVDFLQARMEAGGGIDPRVVSVTPSDDGSQGTTIVTQQAIPASALPSMVASMIPGDPATERTENWRAEGDGYAADFSVIVKGAPASLKGTMALTPADSGATLTVDAAANVPIPMFGEKIENVIVEQISALLQSESDYTRSRLA